jgi:hypothetical protein
MVEKRKRSKTRNKTRSKINKTRRKKRKIISKKSKKSKKTVKMEKILVGTIDIDLDNRVKKGGVQKGGDGEFKTSDLPEILWKLLETLLSRTRGPPTLSQSTRRTNIIHALKEAFGMIYGSHAKSNVEIKLKMKSTSTNTGLLIEFFMPRTFIRIGGRRLLVHNWSDLMNHPFYPFHISLHDTPWRTDSHELTPSPTHVGRWHTTGDSRRLRYFESSTVPLRAITDPERNTYNDNTKARLQLEYKNCVIDAVRSVRVRIKPDDIVFTAGIMDPLIQDPLKNFLKIAITILNNNLFKHIVYQINPDIDMTRGNVEVRSSDLQWVDNDGDLDIEARVKCKFDDEPSVPRGDRPSDSDDDISTGGTKRKTRKRKTRKRERCLI